MEKINNKIHNKYISRGTSVKRILGLTLRDFYLKRNNLALFDNNGKISLANNNYSIYKYFSKFDENFKKWSNRKYRYNYMYRRSFKKRNVRVKIYTKKNVLNTRIDNHIKITRYLNQTINQKQVMSKTGIYEASIFEILLTKIDFMKKLKF
jgi:hypothetical protein